MAIYVVGTEFNDDAIVCGNYSRAIDLANGIGGKVWDAFWNDVTERVEATEIIYVAEEGVA